MGSGESEGGSRPAPSYRVSKQRTTTYNERRTGCQNLRSPEDICVDASPTPMPDTAFVLSVVGALGWLATLGVLAYGSFPGCGRTILPSLRLCRILLTLSFGVLAILFLVCCVPIPVSLVLYVTDHRYLLLFAPVWFGIVQLTIAIHLIAWFRQRISNNAPAQRTLIANKKEACSAPNGGNSEE